MGAHFSLKFRAGERLVFEVQGNALTARVLHARDIDDLFAALPGVDTYVGATAEREAFHEALADKGSSDEA